MPKIYKNTFSGRARIRAPDLLAAMRGILLRGQREGGGGEERAYL